MTACGLIAVIAGCNGVEDEAATAPVSRACQEIASDPVFIEGGTFEMGSVLVYAEEGPVRETTVDGFWIDPHEVSNAQFAEFAEATSYATTAEKPVDPDQFGLPADQIPAEMLQPGSAVFVAPERPSRRYTDWWRYVPGASWKRPEGPSGPEAQDNYPVVHLSHADMVAYAEWKGGRLPTEAEWEYAASARQPAGATQPSGDEANSWQGVFPVVNDETDGFYGIAPVGCFAPNVFGLHDMVGNVWEVTSDFYRPGHDPQDQDRPQGPSETDAYDPLNPGLITRVMKGGSYLCAPNYCQRYRPQARQGRDPGLGASNVGFRLVYDTAPSKLD